MSISRILFAAAALAVALPVMGTAARAGEIERACRASDRSAATASLCSCIGAVADQTLTRADQKIAAKFFSDPHEAQVTRMSSRGSDAAFWARYKNFGTYASSYCD
jgi:hypothetical protein